MIHRFLFLIRIVFLSIFLLCSRPINTSVLAVGASRRVPESKVYHDGLSATLHLSVRPDGLRNALITVTSKEQKELVCNDLANLQTLLSSNVTNCQAKPGRSLPQRLKYIQGESQESFWGVVLTTYFTSRADPLRPDRDPGEVSDYDYMSLWYNSIKGVGLQAVVFHDSLPQSFLEKYSTRDIQYVRVNLAANSSLSQNDERFLIYLDFLEAHPRIKYVLHTDLRDVIINKDPFHLMEQLKQQYDLFVNVERENWIKVPYRRAYGGEYPKQPVMFNAGVFGGKRQAVIDLLRLMEGEFSRLYALKQKRRNYNMAVLNRMLFYNSRFCSRIFTGPPFCAGMVQCDLHFKCNYYVYHKYLQVGELPPCDPMPFFD